MDPDLANHLRANPVSIYPSFDAAVKAYIEVTLFTNLNDPSLICIILLRPWSVTECHDYGPMVIEKASDSSIITFTTASRTVKGHCNFRGCDEITPTGATNLIIPYSP